MIERAGSQAIIGLGIETTGETGLRDGRGRLHAGDRHHEGERVARIGVAGGTAGDRHHRQRDGPRRQHASRLRRVLRGRVGVLQQQAYRHRDAVRRTEEGRRARRRAEASREMPSIAACRSR